MITGLMIFLAWYSIGIISIILYLLWSNYYNKEEITLRVDDLIDFLAIALAGPLLAIIPVVILANYLFEKYDKIKHNVIWKNNRAKIREILFKTEEEDSE